MASPGGTQYPSNLLSSQVAIILQKHVCFFKDFETILRKSVKKTGIE